MIAYIINFYDFCVSVAEAAAGTAGRLYVHRATALPARLTSRGDHSLGVQERGQVISERASERVSQV